MNKIPDTGYSPEDMRTVQELIAALQDFWAKEGCASHHGHDVEVGALYGECDSSLPIV